ncbi:TPR and ankyrin repeat-containing protein 1-like [Mytilus edulis]|uniref:TPR and ankyrin repeat-containing protein 1-like n=1 Tax=Mytilus edulis TaxID=6550 RepID=UPI0039F0B080
MTMHVTKCQKKTGIVLTLYEAKGLEFDDILLFNIFKNSQASKEWRVVTDFLQRQGKDKTLQTGYSSRPLTFDPKLHKVLNSELKQLYTAITRARVNVWIFDEDVEKRTPMFQYFTALGLVKTSIEKNFTVKSTPAEWTASGEELMKRDLYEQAAQCFKMAGCIYKEELAYAYLHYKNARKKIQNSSEMREELYQATLKFLKLKRTKEAAKCLAMAKHYDLAAEIYEKKQWFEKAAEMFRRSNKPSECCRIFEHISRFDKAIAVLQEFNMFDEAIASLRRYKEKKLLNQIRMEDSIREHFYIPKRKYGRPKEAKCYNCSSVICGSLNSTSNLMIHMRRKHREVPLEILIQHDGSGLQNLYSRSDSSLHPLGSLYDEDQININAAGHYHKHHDINQMLKALDNVSRLSDRIEFLTSRYNGRKEYITYAARILINKGETKEAVNLYKKYGFPEEALQFYETKRDSFSYIHCLVLSSLLQMKIKPDGSANAIKARIVEEHLNKSISMLLVCKEGNNDESVDVLTNTEGEANLLLGRLTGRQKYIELAFERFQVRQPLENKWGQMECLNWMMNISDLKRVSHLDLVVKWLQDTLALLYTITSENSSGEKIQLLEDYGVKQEGEKIFYNPRQNPPIRRLMKKVKNKSVKEEVENNEVRRVIVIDLLTNSCKWFWKLLPIVEKNYVNAISVDELNRYCSTFKNLENFLESHVQKIRLDYFLNGIRTFSNPLTKEEKPFLRKFKTYTSNFMSCRYLIRDMIQIVLQFNNLSMKECNCIRGQLIKVREEMDNHFESSLAKARDKLYHKREKNISTFVEIITYHKLFGLSVNVKESIFDLENSISEELLTYLQDKSCSNDQSITKVRKLGFMIPEFTAKPVVISIIRSFSDSVIEMREQKNPYQAVKSFSVFVERLQKQRTEYTLPELNLFLSWIRYYTFVGFVLQSKLATCQKRDDFQFFIPSSFLNTVRYIELTLFDDKLSTEKLIACCNVKKMPQINDIRNILEMFVQLICGIRSKINITNIAFKRLMKSYQVRKMDPGKPDEELFYSDVAVVENVICWSLIFVINMDVAVFTQSETEILRQLSVHQNPDLYPERISNVLADIKSATGINNIKRSLHDFITHRGETLLRCKWDELKGCIIQEECDTQIDSMDTFHLHETLKTLTDQDQIIAESAGEEDIFETEEIKVTDVEIKTVFDDRKKLSTRTNDMELNAKTTKESVYFESGIDEIQNDPLFAKLIIDKSRCDICGEIFEDKINKDNQGERTVNKVVHNLVSTKLSIKSIVNSLWSTSDNIVEPESRLSSKSESLSLQYSSRQSTPSVAETKKHLHSNVNKNIQTEVPSKGNEDFFTFPDPYDKTQQPQKPICTYEKHMLSTSHQDRLAEIRKFHQFYQKCVKPNLERISQFISKYGLFTQENRQQFDEDMRIIRLVILYEECNADLHNIVRLKTWNEHYIAWKLNKLENLHNDVKKSVKELFDVINRKENSEDDDFDRLQYKPHKKTRRKTKWSKIDLK